MVQTRNNSGDSGVGQSDPIAAQLAAIAARLEVVDTMKEEIAALKSRRDRFDEEENSWRPRQNYRPYNKIEFPKFSEGDPRGWILKAEKYFRYYNIPDMEKVDVASMHLEGDALDLYSWLSADQPISFWEELVQALTKNFGPAEFQNPDEHLCSIRQTGSVQEYRQEFAKRSSRVSDWPDHCLLGIFLNGLKEELKADVRIHKPRTVYNAMSLALEFESKTTLLQQPIKVTTKPTPLSTTTAGTTPPVSSLRISDEEKQSRFTKGLCFRCGDKYGPGHRCKTGSLQLLEADNASETRTTAEAADFQVDQEDIAQISLHAILGKSQLPTLTLKGTINSADVMVLVDSGSTHNFVADSLVKKVQLPTEALTPFGVRIGNGQIEGCNQICKNVVLKIGNLKITQDFYPFSLGGYDVVLGIQWLATLNTVQANWKEMFLVFNAAGREYKLQGVSPGDSNSSTLYHFNAKPFKEQLHGGTAWFQPTRLEDKSSIRAGSIDRDPVNQGGVNQGGASYNPVNKEQKSRAELMVG